MISNLKDKKENKEYLKNVIGVKGKLIDWKNSVDKEIGYEYCWKGEYFKGIIKIIRYEPKSHKVYFEGYKEGITTDSIIRCNLGGILGFRTLEFKYKIKDSKNNLTIIDREYKYDKKDRKCKYYKYKCNICGHEDWISEGNLKKGKGCNACCPSPRKAVLGVNTIWDKTKWMVNLGVSEEDAKKYTPNSTEEIYVKCPDCKRIKKITPHEIYRRRSIYCSCGDGVSYPEKLMEGVLIQLGVKYERQYKADWVNNKVYDFYLLDTNTIIETHGGQHYEECSRGRSLKEEQENDKLKEELALSNGIEHYIIIDCRESTLNWVKNNILDSELNELFDLNKVDWNKCEEYALKNKVKEICKYYDMSSVTISDLIKEFGISRGTIIRYLKKGDELGWCKYNPKEEKRRGIELSSELSSKPVSQFTLDGEFIKVYPSASEASRQTGICNIGKCCNGKQKTAGGFIWRFAE